MSVFSVLYLCDAGSDAIPAVLTWAHVHYHALDLMHESRPFLGAINNKKGAISDGARFMNPSIGSAYASR